jgi:hypothetical protein
MSYQPEVAAGPVPALGVNTDPKPVKMTQPKQPDVREWKTCDLRAVIHVICKNEEVIRFVYRTKQLRQRGVQNKKRRSGERVDWFEVCEELTRQANIGLFGKSKADTHERRILVHDVRCVLSYIMIKNWSAISYVEEQSPPYRISSTKTMAFARMHVDFNRKLRDFVEKARRENRKRAKARRAEELRKRTAAAKFRASLARGFSNRHMGSVVRSLRSIRRRRAIYSASPTPSGRKGRRREARQSEPLDESFIDPILRDGSASESQSSPSPVLTPPDLFAPEPRQISVPPTWPPTPYPQSDPLPRQQAPHPDIYLRETPLSPVPSFSLGSPVCPLPVLQQDADIFPRTNSYPDPNHL